jgi:pimeloyl-ACP methyl ester carboxylesterase
VADSRSGPGKDGPPPADGDLHLIERGSGPRLVLVHGVAGSHMVWDAFAKQLEHRYTLTAIDLLGYGHSPKPRTIYTPEVHVASIRSTLRARSIEPPYTFVGLSMGANLVLEFARRWPGEVKELVGVGFPYYASETEARTALQYNTWTRWTLNHPFLASVATPIVWGIGRRAVPLVRRGGGLYEPAVAADALRARYMAFKSSLFNCMVHFRQEEALEASGTMRRLFIHGDDDQWAPPSAVENRLGKYPRTTVRVISGPHNLVVADPREMAKLISDHLVGRGPSISTEPECPPGEP